MPPRTLFGRRAVVRERGRVGRLGAVLAGWSETEATAIEAGAKIRKQKERRGYRAIGGAEEG